VVNVSNLVYVIRQAAPQAVRTTVGRCGRKVPAATPVTLQLWLINIYFIFAIDIVSYCDFLASSSAIDVDRRHTSYTCCLDLSGLHPD